MEEDEHCSSRRREERQTDRELGRGVEEGGWGKSAGGKVCGGGGGGGNRLHITCRLRLAFCINMQNKLEGEYI